MKSLGVPNVCLHPRSVLFLAQLVQVEQEAELAAMTTAFRTGESFAFVWCELVQSFVPDSHWDPVVVVSHASSAQMARNQLDFHLRADFHFEDVCEMTQFMRTTAHKLMQVDELRHFLLLS